jgi:uncharacterized protein YgiM (DUF1202 family)
MKRLFFILMILFCLNAVVFSQSLGKTMYVAVNSAEIKSSTGLLGKSLGKLALGEPVTVLRENGKWSEVRTEKSLTGWVAATSLSSKRVIGQGRTASAREIALAGKGFSQETEVEYRKNGLDFSIVDTMEKLAIPDDELLKFVTDGRLNEGK